MSLLDIGTKILGGFMGRKAQKTEYERQKEFAQEGIRWKVADAKAAGIHPLYALGASTASYSPSTVGDPLADALRDGSQDISRAAAATMNMPQRMTAIQKTQQNLVTQRMELENQLLASQIRKTNMMAPPSPVGARWLVEGQGNTQSGSLVKDNPMERTVANPRSPHTEPGAVPDVGYVRTKSGFAPVPSKDAKERIEDNFIQEVMWAIRNNIFPSLGINESPPTAPLPEGQRWRFNPWKQEYTPHKRFWGFDY